MQDRVKYQSIGVVHYAAVLYLAQLHPYPLSSVRPLAYQATAPRKLAAEYLRDCDSWEIAPCRDIRKTAGLIADPNPRTSDIRVSKMHRALDLLCSGPIQELWVRPWAYDAGPPSCN